ncbi:MAG TPA: glycoside hydrolase family 15 protein [Solirubrobacteraceae bacterium]|nr:glycoside hydrolase family 15 protein [Solirubrobacteraceae bacterium]
MSELPQIGELAVIGDARTTAVIGPRGAVELLCLPQLDDQIVLGRLLDRQAGVFELEPSEENALAEQRYAHHSNVLVTRWRCARGEAVVMDALIGGPGGEAATTTLVRRVDCVSGRVGMRFRLAPRFGEGLTAPTAVQTVPGGVRIDGPDLVVSFGGAAAEWQDDALVGTLELDAGDRRTLSFAHGESPPAPELAARYLDTTLRAWRAWTAGLQYDGRWSEAVIRSALALRMLIRDTSGAIAAAGTLGLPEQPGGERNYDYRYCWLRDASFVVDALCSVGARESARRYLEWLGGALDSTTPRLQPFYRLDGGGDAPEHTAALLGYGGASPVRIGNRAYAQLQLGSCGDMLQSCALLQEHRVDLPAELTRGITRAIDHLTTIWREADSGIWEIEPNRQHTWSKMACWIAFTRAAELQEQGLIDGDARDWRRAAEAVREHIETRHYSTRRGSYLAAEGETGLDAAVLLGVFMGYEPSDPERWTGTLEAIDRELGVGPFLYRTTELRGRERTFLPCAFWRAHALVRLGRLEEARDLLDQLIAATGPLGLFAEEADEAGAQWGNVPQALTHAALINACVTYEQRAGSG